MLLAVFPYTFLQSEWRTLAGTWLAFPRLLGTSNTSIYDRLAEGKDAKVLPCRCILKCALAVYCLSHIVFLASPMFISWPEDTNGPLLILFLFLNYLFITVTITSGFSVFTNKSPTFTLAEYGVLGQVALRNVVRRSLMDRSPTVPQDRFLSLYGVFARLGYAMPVPDYNQDILELKAACLGSLINSDPKNLALLVDASVATSHAGGPSWCPEWPQSRVYTRWLPKDLALGHAPGKHPLQPSSIASSSILRLNTLSVSKVNALFAFDRTNSDSVEITTKTGVETLVTFLRRVDLSTTPIRRCRYCTRPGILSTVLKPTDDVFPKLGGYSPSYEEAAYPFLRSAGDGATVSETGEKRDHYRRSKAFDLLLAIMDRCQNAHCGDTEDSNYLGSVYAKVRAAAKLYDWLTAYIAELVLEMRCFARLSTGAPITGSSHLAVGDEIVWIPHVPTLMALRKRPEGGGCVIVGPVSALYELKERYKSSEFNLVDIY